MNKAFPKSGTTAYFRTLQRLTICWCFLAFQQAAMAVEPPQQKLMARWERLLVDSLNEAAFHEACSLIAVLADHNAGTGMACTDRLIKRIRPLNNRRWMHALLTNKYELGQLVYPFIDSAKTLATAIRRNAEERRDAIYREALVYGAHACIQSGDTAQASRIIDAGIRYCFAAKDSLNLAMLYVFRGELLSATAPAREQALTFIQKAQDISANLPNKTPYFTASYRAAHLAHLHNPSRLVEALERLIPLSKHPSLIKQDLSTQTFLPFAKPVFTLYLDLMRLNLVLMDAPSARRIYKLIEGELIARKRKTGILSNRSIGMLVSDRAVIEAFAGNSQLTAKLLDSCRNYFSPVPESEIPSVNYFLARALLNEMDGRYAEMLNSLKLLKTKYIGAVLPLSMSTLFAHAYALNGDDIRARQYFSHAVTDLSSREYSAAGYYHYKYYADWLYRQKDYRTYAQALRKFYSIKDSVASIQQLRHIQNVQDQRYIKERDLEIAYLNKIRQADLRAARSVRISGLAVLAALLFATIVLYSRNRQRKKSNVTLLEKNHRIETLIRELHHRVKNNLQVISSLLSLQSLRMEEGEARQAVAEGQRRVQSMALIHEKLYQHEDLSGVDMKAYVNDLVYHLADSFGASSVGLHLEIDEVLLHIDTAVPLGLIINELVTNSLKHGVGKHLGDRLYVGLTDREKYYQLSLSDNGPGLPAGFNISTSASFGLKLVSQLVRQLRATITWKSNTGAAFELTIPKRQ